MVTYDTPLGLSSGIGGKELTNPNFIMQCKLKMCSLAILNKEDVRDS